MMKLPPLTRHVFFFKLGLALAGLALTAGCASTRMPATATPLKAEGVYVRHIRLRPAPSHAVAYEAIMKRCVEAASASQLPERFDWLSYREPPGRYWILLFSDTIDGFATPKSFVGFTEQVCRAEGEPAQTEIMVMLADLEYKTEWEVVFQQKTKWSTVEEMSTSTHRKARIMDRTIRPGMEAAFDAALVSWTAFLVKQGYPLPIEGFVVRSGAPGRAQQVVFPMDWSTFYDTASFSAFFSGLDETLQEEYGARNAALMATMARAENYDGDFARELSYAAE